ncbi:MULTISPECIES: YolD-like family protein [Paenibacillus]|uniref:YolD-like family protein n=1 Tax=Paenibacillus vandeheii TaxID=3035917 RepID=A0ABT8JGY6_9BACL|nr:MULTISPECIES: YolD-like family protein [Paenibacillus]MDN4603841.1 YolD-like family protein [Paenibacillus vandeheii]
MSKKLEANGLWESNRMMLPQHKERINEHRTQIHYQSKPHIHEDEWEIIAQNLEMSLNYTLSANFEVFNESGNWYLHGIVTSISTMGKKIKIEMDNGFEFVDFDQLVSVKLEGGGEYGEADF